MDDSRGIAPKVGQYPEGLLAIPWIEILLHSRRPSRLAGIWKSHGEGHCVKADHNFSMSGRIVNFLRETKRLSLIVLSELANCNGMRVRFDQDQLN
jgi:hypothetical protein